MADMPHSEAEHEMARMLLWFKAQLPSHELSEWFIKSEPIGISTVIEDSQTRVTHMRSWTETGHSHRITGYGRCVRCGQQFPVPSSGDAVASCEANIPRLVEKMKSWARRSAERAGPCWGDVPGP